MGPTLAAAGQCCAEQEARSPPLGSGARRGLAAASRTTGERPHAGGDTHPPEGARHPRQRQHDLVLP